MSEKIDIMQSTIDFLCDTTARRWQESYSISGSDFWIPAGGDESKTYSFSCTFQLKGK